MYPIHYLYICMDWLIKNTNKQQQIKSRIFLELAFEK